MIKEMISSHRSDQFAARTDSVLKCKIQLIGRRIIVAPNLFFIFIFFFGIIGKYVSLQLRLL